MDHGLLRRAPPRRRGGADERLVEGRGAGLWHRPFGHAAGHRRRGARPPAGGPHRPRRAGADGQDRGRGRRRTRLRAARRRAGECRGGPLVPAAGRSRGRRDDHVHERLDRRAQGGGVDAAGDRQRLAQLSRHRPRPASARHRRRRARRRTAGHAAQRAAVPHHRLGPGPAGVDRHRAEDGHHAQVGRRRCAAPDRGGESDLFRRRADHGAGADEPPRPRQVRPVEPGRHRQRRRAAPARACRAHPAGVPRQAPGPGLWPDRDQRRRRRHLPRQLSRQARTRPGGRRRRWSRSASSTPTAAT